MTTNEIVADGVSAIAAAAVTDAAALTTDLTGVDTGTDMTAAQAAQIEADLAELRTQLNALLAALRTAGTLAS